MGRFEKSSSSNALAVQLNAEGKVKYDVIARLGMPEFGDFHPTNVFF
jgi:hypothetical protein